MFAQPYGALPPVPTPSPGDDDDVWHVAISWDDVKVMSVDQLDDAFRLDIINSETPVWQNGMSGWQPLGVVAGIGGDSEDEDEDSQEDVLTDAELEVVWPPFPAPIKPSAVRSVRPTPAPPRPPSRAPLPPTPVLAPMPRVPTSTAWPALSAPLAPPPARQAIAPVIPLAPRPTATLVPPAGFGAPSALYQAANVNAAPRHPPTVPPVAMSVTMPPPRRRGSSGAASFGRWVLALAFVGGLATTLYRNDVLLEAAQKSGFEKQYLSAERAIVGSPGFGTLRSLAALVSVEGLKLGSSSTATPAAITVTETPSPAADDTKDDTKTEAAPSTDTKPSSASKVEGAVDVSSLKVEHAGRAKEAPAKEAPAPKAAAPKEVAPKAAPREVARKEAAPKNDKVSKAQAKAAEKAEKKAKEKPKSDERAAALALIEKAKAARATKEAASKPEKSEPKEAPKRAAPPPREEKPVAQKPKRPESALDAAIRDSMEKANSAPAKKKKAGPNADYDPMNGDL